MANTERNQADSLSGILSQGDMTPEQLRESLSAVHPVDLAEFLDDLDLEERIRVFELLEPGLAAQVMASMPHDYKVQLVDKVGEEKLTPVIDRMPDAAVADVIDHLPAHKEKILLDRLDQQHAGNIQELRKYDPHTAGGRMTRNFVTVTEEMTARQIIQSIQGAVDPHTVDFIYVLDEKGCLKGISSLARLMLHKPEEQVGTFMRREFSFVGPNTDQEEVAQMAQKYRIRAVPVLDTGMKMLGVVTLQDIVDVIQHEASEDMMKMAGATMVDSLHTPTWKRYRMRLPWLFLTLGGELFIALVITSFFRETLEKAAILAAFMPAIMATGGNVGLQSTTLIIRGLGMGTIRLGMFLRVVASELRLGVMLGVTCGLGAALMAMILERNHGQVLKLGVAIFMAMISATCATSIVGAVEPLVLHRFKLDPATACGPFVTMFNDLFGTTVYFLIAMLLGFSSS